MTMHGKDNAVVSLCDTLNHAVNVLGHRDQLQARVVEQSQIIAALVMSNGGVIRGACWDLANAQRSFIPYSKGMKANGDITIMLDDELAPPSETDK